MDLINRKIISQTIIRRLPRYYRYLGELKAEGVERISSGEFARILGVTASQVRQDLNNFGGFGQQGYGYNVAKLYEEIGRILRLDQKHRMVVIGAGNLGRAIAGYHNFEAYSFYIEALFDKDPQKIGRSFCDLPVYDVETVCDYINEHHIDVAAITVPKEPAREIAEKLKNTCLKGVWNFAHTDLYISPDIVVQNVSISESLMQLSYNMSKKHPKGEAGVPLQNIRRN